MVVLVLKGESEITLLGGMITCNCGKEVTGSFEFGSVIICKGDIVSEIIGEIIGMPGESSRSIVINSSIVINEPIVGNPVKGWKSKDCLVGVRDVEMRDFWLDFRGWYIGDIG